MTPQQVQAIAEWNIANHIARREYYRHPFSGRGEHGKHCADLGCLDGLAVQLKNVSGNR